MLLIWWRCIRLEEELAEHVQLPKFVESNTGMLSLSGGYGNQGVPPVLIAHLLSFCAERFENGTSSHHVMLNDNVCKAGQPNIIRHYPIKYSNTGQNACPE